MSNESVFQFRITLQDIRPAIWRCIQIKKQCTFWDLHVAIQDAMGWTDSHLHEFKVFNPATGKKEYIGIPDDEGEDVHPMLAGWDVKVEHYMRSEANHEIRYLYDFGDSWEHLIKFEGKQEKHFDKYPVCLAGERACPPEDVGGIAGYENFIAIIKNPRHKERKELLTWVGGKYDPADFDPKKVKFDNPKIRWRRAFA
jgi:Plasmid pRiA4b ORF-3-like protein